MRAQIERLLERESRSETTLRPLLIEASFGDGDDAKKPALHLGDLALHGMIDRVDVTPDERFGVVYDYKTSSKVTSGAKLAEAGKLQLQLYARAIRDQWGIEPLGGLYYQLGGSRDPKPRGFVAGGDTTEGLDLKKPDFMDLDQVEETVEAGVETARERAAAMRRGAIGRDPNGGECPSWCQLPADLPTRARGRLGRWRRQRERGQRIVTGAPPEQLALLDAEPDPERPPEVFARTPAQRDAIACRDRDVFTEAGAGSGKTGVLVERYCDSVTEDGLGPEDDPGVHVHRAGRRRAATSGFGVG